MPDRRAFLAKALGLLAVTAGPQVHARTMMDVRVAGLSTRLSFGAYYFGWIPNSPVFKARAELFETPEQVAYSLPSSVDLRPAMPPVYDQEKVGSCVANSLAAMIQYVRKKNKQSPDFVPSRLFLYYNGRVIENSVAADPGMSLEDATAVVANVGVCSENDWPYDGRALCDQDDSASHCVRGQWPPNSRNPVHPPKAIYDQAYLHRAIAARNVPQRIEELKGCLAEGYPFAFGFTIYDNFFESPTNVPPTTAPRKIIAMPETLSLPVGQHAVVAVGYDDQRKLFTCRNSWGTVDRATGREMQDKGHFYMPYDYLLDTQLSSDFVTIRSLAAIQ